MKISRLFLLAAIFLLGVVSVSGLYAQTAGDFRSFQNGAWNDLNSWERYDGAFWVNPAPSYPISTTAGIVTILSGDTITVTATDSVDEVTVSAGGGLIILAGNTLNIENGTGTDLTVNGLLINQGDITVDAGADIAVGAAGLYRHDQNGGTIPTVTWISGATCEVTGATSSSPGNANQNFHNFTWNCPSQSSNLNLSWSGNTVGGDLTVTSSGGSQFRLTNSSSYADTITIAGNVMLASGTLTTTGSSGGQTYVVEILGDVTATGGTLAPSRGSGGFATWRLHGDLTVTNTQLRSSNNQSRFAFAKGDTQTVTYEGATYNGTFHYEVEDSSTVLIADGPDAVDVVVHDSLICRGEVLAVGALTFENGGVYVHARNGGSVPVATWATGSTCAITGVTSSKPSNLSQDYYDFVWDCAGQSSNLDWSWYNNTVSGSVSVLNSGGSRARMTSSGASPLGPNTITIQGDVNVVGASFESTGSGSPDTLIIESNGNLSATGGGTLAVSRSSAVDVIWNLYGDLTIDNSTTRCSRDTLANFHFKGSGTQTLSLINATINDRLPIIVEGGATLNLDSSFVTGSGDFAAQAGATLQTPMPGGFDDNLLMSGAINLSKQANFTLNGSTAQTSGLIMPDSVNVLTMDNAAGVTVIDTITCADLQTTVSTQLSIPDTGSLTADAGSVFGTVVNQGELVGSASLVFEAGATYQHDRNGGNIPTATWAPTSHCLITGVTGSSPGNSSQNFGHFTWNCPGQSSNMDWGWYNNTISGNVSVLSSGSARARMTSPGASPAGANTISIIGDLIVNNANFESNGSSSDDTITVETFGDIMATGGILAVSRGSGPMVKWIVLGDFTMDNAETRNSGGVKASYYFEKPGTQTLTMINPTFGGGGFPAVVSNGTTLNLDSSVVAGSGNFAVDAGATLATTLAGGLDANLTTSGTVSLSKAGNYMFNGTTAQVTGTLLPDTVSQLMVANAAGVSLSGGVVVSDTLQLMAGKLTLGANSVETYAVGGGSSSAYVVTDGTGTLNRNVSSTEVAFPVGTAASYAPAWITNTGTTDDFSVGVEPNAGSATSRVNLMWNISEAVAGGSTATLKLGWMASEETSEFSSNRAADALIFDFADTSEAGSGAYTRQLSTEPYTVSRGGFSTFGTFAVGDFIGTATSVEEEEALPTVFALSQNYPNPFNPTTVIQYDIPTATHVSIRVYDALGRVVSELVNEERVPGFYTAEWNAAGFASGVYYYRIVAGDFVAVKKMLLVR